MLQPFEKFKPQYIQRLLDLNKPCLVTQQYRRTIASGNGKIALLVSDYDDPGLARIHYKAVMGDRYAAIVHLDRPAHADKIREMLEPDSAYELYWAIVKSKKQLEEKINSGYKDRMREYITQNTNWRMDRNASVRPSVQMIFGELFIVIKHGKQVVRVKFEELENE
ncbi:MAG: hypothetical protein EOO04_23875 [Chitinophagaceae bacterium]|nr:MAG: hypothetical protein EOO04_23875 [Chitinophagaceae bacterium]